MCNKILLIFCLLFCLSCLQNQPNIIIAGKLPYKHANGLRLVEVNSYFPGLKQNGTTPKFETDTDQKGHFKFELDSLKSGFYQLVYKNFGLSPYDIYLDDVDSIFIDLSLQDQKIKISGNQSKKFSYLDEDLKYIEQINTFLKKSRSKGQTDEMKFKHYIDSLHLVRMYNLAKVDKIFDIEKAYFRDHINAEMTGHRLWYLNYHDFFQNDKLPDQAYFTFLDSLNLTAQFSKTTSAKMLANIYLDFKTRQALFDEDEQVWWSKGLKQKFDYIKNLENSEWKDILALSSVYNLDFLMDRDNFFQDLSPLKQNVQYKKGQKKVKKQL